MTCLKKFKWILFLLGFIASLQIILIHRTERLIKTVETFEPVVIRQVIEPEKNHEPSPEPSPEPTAVPKSIEIPFRINCRLDDETQQMIVEKCKEYDVDFTFAMAVIYCESSFRPNIVSYNGSSVGLMQINKINHERLSETLGLTDFFDPEQNVTAGLYMLRELFDKYEDPAMVLMAYNMGESGARELWDQGVFTSAYAEKVLRQADMYDIEIQERMGEDVLHG